MKAAITVAITLGFLCLAHYAYTHKPEEAAYTQSVFSVLDKPRSKSTQSLAAAQAKALAYVYDLTPEDAAKPVMIWGEQNHE